MDWWNSFETVSKIQTGLAILLTLLGFVTLTFKVRGDHLKKAADKGKSEEHAKLEADLLKQTWEAHTLAEQIKQQQEGERLRALPRHFPTDRSEQFLKVAGEGVTGPLRLQLAYVFTQDGEPRNLAAEFVTLFGGNPASMSAITANNVHIKGIVVQEHADTATPSQFALNLVAAFESVGFKCTYEKGAPTPGVVCVVVGTKE
ncbi:MAG: hypothetical protein ABJF10_28790 [Chthoniobacter sp.]|uniref:hypothetical protein n=1 Tax=Chthoniobacter sp. TaxID=2510640 RepID=UPI0032ADA43F